MAPITRNKSFTQSLKTPEKKKIPLSDTRSAGRSPGLSRELKLLNLSSPDSSRKKPRRTIFGKSPSISPNDSDKENQGIPGRPRKSPRKMNNLPKKQPFVVDSNLEVSFDEDDVFLGKKEIPKKFSIEQSLRTPEKRKIQSNASDVKSPGLSRELKSLNISCDSSKKKPGRRILGENKAEIIGDNVIRISLRRSPRKSAAAPSPKKPQMIDNNLEMSFDEDEYIPEKLGSHSEDDDSFDSVSEEDSDFAFESTSRKTISKKSKNPKSDETAFQKKREFVDYIPELLDVTVRIPLLSEFEYYAIEDDFEKWKTLREKRAKHPLMKVYAALHTSAVPDVLLNRNKEVKEIETFIKHAISPKANANSRSVYISGVPGTGKTASVMKAIENLKNMNFTFAYVNGLELVQPNHVFVELYKAMFPNSRKTSAKMARTKLAKIFSVTDSKRIPVVFVVDELDMIVTKKQDVVYDIFDWAATEGSRLAVISIANTLDLPERLLKQRVSSRLGFNRLIFEPYNYKEIESILSHRIKGSSAFQKGSIDLISRKVASISGDLRKALELVRRSIEIAVDNDARELQMAHVNAALRENQLSLPVVFTKGLSKHQEILLRSVVNELKSTQFEEVDYHFVYRNYEGQCYSNALEPMEMTDALCLLTSLQSCGYLTIKGTNQISRKILLNHTIDQVESWLKEIPTTR